MHAAESLELLMCLMNLHMAEKTKTKISFWQAELATPLGI